MLKDFKLLNVDDDVNLYVVGDIHGEYTMLMNKLKSIGFDFSKDLLISVGDCVDRSDESDKCVGLINESWFTSIRGNHEDFCIKGSQDYRYEWQHKQPNNGGAWFYELPENLRVAIANIFKELPVMLEVNYLGRKLGFVHAGLPDGDWEVVKQMLINNEFARDRRIQDYLMWSRGLVSMCTEDGYIPHIDNVDHVFFGHTVMTKPLHVGNCSFIDTGAVFKKIDDVYDLTIINIRDFITN